MVSPLKMSENPTIEFGTVVRAHLKALRIEQQELADALGVKPSQVSAWFAEEGTSSYRAVPVDAVGRIADFLKFRYDKVDVPGSEKLGSRTPFELANQLLTAARLTHTLGTKEDSIWWRIRSIRAKQGKPPELNVGWFPWGNFAKEEFSGLSRIITEDLFRLMGLSFKTVKLHHYADMAGYLDNHKVDMIAPLLLAPYRMFQFSCSASIGRMCGLNLLGVREHIRPLLPPGKDFILDAQELDATKFRICYVSGGVAQYLRPKLMGSEPASEIHDTLAEAIESVLDTPVDKSGAVRLFCGDQFTCRAVEMANTKRDPLLLFHTPCNKLPIVFGVAPNEQGLLQIINQAIELLLPRTTKLFDEDPFFSDLYGVRANESEVIVKSASRSV